MKQSFNAQSRLEAELHNALSLKQLFAIILENQPTTQSALTLKPGMADSEQLRWKHAYFFFRGLRHIQYLQGRSGQPVGMDHRLQAEEDQVFKILSEVIFRHGYIKSY
jgi:hypothetical protein